MTSQFSQLFWEDLIVTVPVKDDECSRGLCKFLRKKPVKVLNILKGGNSFSLSILKHKTNLYRDLIDRSMICDLLIYDK